MNLSKNSKLKRFKFKLISILFVFSFIFSISCFSCNLLSTTNNSFGVNSEHDLNYNIIYNQSTFTTNLSQYSYNYSENFSIFVHYEDIVSNSNVTDATISCYIQESLYANFNNIGDGDYSIQINTSFTPLIIIGDNEVSIRATSPTAERKTLTLTITINSAPTELAVLNGSLEVAEGSLFNLTYSYNNTGINPKQGIENATIAPLINGSSLNKVTLGESLLNNSVYHVYNMSNGYYNIELNLTYGANVTLNITSTLIKTSFVSNSCSLIVNSTVHSTNLTYSLVNFQVDWQNITGWQLSH